MAVSVWGLHAQNDEEQVLVFRHTGVVNLFYQSDLDSITLSKYDADSTLYEEVISQVFHTKDTIMFVPIAEIDSVAFGNRNVIEMRKDVKELTEAVDLPWIIRFDGYSIFYRLNTPDDVLPKVEQRLFYGLDGKEEETSVFPYGLTAKATTVTKLDDEIRVDIEVVELKEIFNKLFFAGRVYKQESAAIKKLKTIPVHGEADINVKLPVEKLGDIDFYGKCVVDGPIVFNPFTQYTFLDLDIDVSVGMDVHLEADEGTEINYESIGDNYKNILSYLKLVNVDLAAGAFADLNASMTLSLGMERNYHRKLKYEKKGDDQTWDFPEMPAEQQKTDKARIDLTLDGSVFWGPIGAVQVTIVGKVIGARAKLKFGPKIEGQLNIGMLKEMRDYNPTFYGSAQLQICNRIALEGYIINREKLVKGKVVEHKVASLAWEVNKHTLDLFPNYTQTKGVQVTKQEETEVSVATKVDNEIPHEVETGFDLLDANDEIIDSVFVEKTIEPNSTEVQGFSSKFEVPEQIDVETNPLRVRPIFHYAGYTISSEYANVMHDSHIMPITSYGTNGNATFISGASVIGTAKHDDTVYHIGNYLPIPVKDPVFINDDTGHNSGHNSGRYIDTESLPQLYGTWKGNIDGVETEITFNEDDAHSGTYLVNGENKSFIYDLNTPQSGDIRLLFNDQSVFIFSVVSITDTTLELRKKGNNSSFILNKLY